MAAPRKAGAGFIPTTGVDFGSMGSYSGGFTLPEGDYSIEFEVAMERLNDKQQGRSPRLGVYLHATPLTGGDVFDQFLSMGGKAALSFAPDPNTGKGLVSIPGGAGGGLNNSTNWYMFLKSLYDCGLPEGVFTNDFTVLDGINVHTQNVPEPEERKGFASSTGEVEMERKGPRLIPVVTEIKDPKPWEQTGGAKVSPINRPKPSVPARPPITSTPATTPATPAAEVEDVEAMAIAAVTDVLVASPAGSTKLLLRTNTFKAASKKYGEEGAQQVLNTYFGSDETLGTLLGQLGYELAGQMVKPLS